MYCVHFRSKKKSDNIYRIVHEIFFLLQIYNLKNYQKALSFCIKIELRDTRGEPIPFMSVGITPVVLFFRNISDSNYRFIFHVKWLLKSWLFLPFFMDMQDSVEGVLVLLHKFLGELESPLLKTRWSQQQKEME